METFKEEKKIEENDEDILKKQITKVEEENEVKENDYKNNDENLKNLQARKYFITQTNAFKLNEPYY